MNHLLLNSFSYRFSSGVSMTLTEDCGQISCLLANKVILRTLLPNFQNIGSPVFSPKQQTHHKPLESNLHRSNSHLPVKSTCSINENTQNQKLWRNVHSLRGKLSPNFAVPQYPRLLNFTRTHSTLPSEEHTRMTMQIRLRLFAQYLSGKRRMPIYIFFKQSCHLQGQLKQRIEVPVKTTRKYSTRLRR